MASTQYQIFCKYYHSSVNKIVNNLTKVKWVQAEDNPNRNSYNTAESKPGIENCWIRPENGNESDDWKKKAVMLDNRFNKIITDETNANNPKYDMVFIYDGVTSVTGPNKIDTDGDDNATPPIVYYERMKRMEVTPWFLYATCASLNAAMTKASELVSIIGKENVMIGKVVALDQYIEIV